MIRENEQNTISQQSLTTFTYNLLVKLSWLQRRRYTVWVWRKLVGFCNKNFEGTVLTTIHGRKVLVNFGYPYPFIARMIATFNNPLIELIYQRYSAVNKPLNLIDVGASIGDTILLAYSNCPGMIQNAYCIEGEDGFFRLLQYNLREFKNVKLFHLMFSSEQGIGKSLVRHHVGTASSTGEGTVATTTLDALSKMEGIGGVDILKIDVDGYDGRVLQGAVKFLRKNSADVIFEWHPMLCRKAGNDPHAHFNVLSKLGYSTFVFFNKLGEFTNFMTGYDEASIGHLEEYCSAEGASDDWHYDVVAIHRRSKVRPSSLALAQYARKKPSPF